MPCKKNLGSVGASEFALSSKDKRETPFGRSVAEDRQDETWGIELKARDYANSPNIIWVEHFFDSIPCVEFSIHV